MSVLLETSELDLVKEQKKTVSKIKCQLTLTEEQLQWVENNSPDQKEETENNVHSVRVAWLVKAEIIPQAATSDAANPLKSATSDAARPPKSATSEAVSPPKSATSDPATSPKGATDDKAGDMSVAAPPQITISESTTPTESATSESAAPTESATSESAAPTESATSESANPPESATSESTPPPESATSDVAQDADSQSELVIHHVVRRDKQPDFALSLSQIKLTGPHSVCVQWLDALNGLVAKLGPQRPKSLLVIVNPVSGHKKSEKIYKQQAEPVFNLFGITAEVVFTTKSNESKDILEKKDLSQYDGLVSVGGDGTHTEVCSALLDLTMKSAGVDDVTLSTVPRAPSIRFGMIPAGSGNAQQLFSSYNQDVLTSILVIAMGNSRSRDLLTIHSGEKFVRYSFLMIAYGLISQALELMEKNRWAGPARYLAMGFITLIKRTPVEVQIDYIPAEEHVESPKTEINNAEILSKVEEIQIQAEEIQTKVEEVKEKTERVKAKVDEAKAKVDEIKTKVEEMEGASSPEPEGAEGDVGTATGHTHEHLLPGWKRLTGKYLALECFKSRIDKINFRRLYMYNAEAELQAGIMGLCVTEPCGRLEHVKFMRTLLKGETLKAYEGARFAKVLGVKRFRIKAIGNWQSSPKASVIAWDGDILNLPEPQYEVQLHQKIVPTFCRDDGDELKEICLQEEAQKGTGASNDKS